MTTMTLTEPLQNILQKFTITNPLDITALFIAIDQHSGVSHLDLTAKSRFRTPDPVSIVLNNAV